MKTKLKGKVLAILMSLAMVFTMMPATQLGHVHAAGETPAGVGTYYTINDVYYNNIGAYPNGDPNEDPENDNTLFPKSSKAFLEKALTAKNIYNGDTRQYKDNKLNDLSLPVGHARYDEFLPWKCLSTRTQANHDVLMALSSDGAGILRGVNSFYYEKALYDDNDNQYTKKYPINLGPKYISDFRSLSNTWDYIAPVALSISQGKNYAGYDSLFRMIARFNNTDDEVNVPWFWDSSTKTESTGLLLHRSEMMNASSMKQMEEKVALKLLEYMNNDNWGPDRRSWAEDRFFTGDTNIFTRIFDKDDTEQPLFFKVFSVNRWDNSGDLHLGKRNGADMHGHAMKSAFVLLYSDFKVSPLCPEDRGRNYVVEDESLPETESGVYASNVRNMTSETARADQQISKTQSASVSSNINGSFSYGFEESLMVGAEKKFGGFKGTMELSFTASQTVESGWEEATENTEESSQSYNVGIDLPPYTTVMLKQQSGTTIRRSNYNCPVAVSFRVRILPIYTYDSGTSSLSTKYTIGTADKDVDILSRKDFKDRAFDNANYTDSDGINWGAKRSTEGDFHFNTREAVRNMSMGTTAANFVEKISTTGTEISGLAPVLPLSKVVSNDDVFEYQMSVGDYAYLDSIELLGLNTKNAPYYGFDAQKGHWELVDEDGEPLNDSNSVARIDTTPAKLSKMTAVKPGKAYAKYFINEDCYATAENSEQWRKNDQLERTVMIEVNVKEEPFDGRIEVDGGFTGYLGDDFTTFTGDDGITAAVVDNTGKELDRLLTWEAKELPARGVEVQESGTVKFTKTGTFHVRAISGDIKSDWIEIKATRKPVKATFVYPDGTEPTVIDTLRGEEVTAPESKDPCVRIDGWFENANMSGDASLQDKGTFEIVDNITFYAETSPNHDIGEVSKVAATCTESGTEAHWKCKTCGMLFSNENGSSIIDTPETIDPTDHKYSKWTKLDGEQHKRICENDPDHVEKADHNWDDGTVRVDPQCAAPGVRTLTCKDCDAEKHIQIDPIKHEYGEWIKLDDELHQSVCKHDDTHVKKESHKWDAGKVTQAATVYAEGTRIYTCAVCNGTKAETIPKLKASGTKAETVTKLNVSGTPTAKMKTGKTSLTIGWNKVQNVAGYDIFLAKCNHGKKDRPCKLVKTIKGNNTFKWTKIGLKKTTAYKGYVKAYVMMNGKKMYVNTSPMIHAFTGNGTKKYTNAKSVKVKKANVTLKKGKTFKIKAKVVKVKKNKKLMPKSHAPTLRYTTSNSRIATVSKRGKIKAKGSGTCYISVIAHNGISKQIKVTVK